MKKEAGDRLISEISNRGGRIHQSDLDDIINGGIGAATMSDYHKAVDELIKTGELTLEIGHREANYATGKKYRSDIYIVYPTIYQLKK